ncbi:MAG: hypothetical protein F4100_02250 [Rhodothermaceae bacterium]|nr:hypothetical protein [Rhodothermaceae bacterium]MYJ19556.1 hypothetical protein [Rhodothermaceae bacterium]
MKTRFALIFAVTFLLNFLTVWESGAQRPRIPSPDEVIEQLVSSDHTVSFNGIGGYKALPLDQRTPEVKSALVKALENENERVRRIMLSGDDSMPMYKDEGSAERALALVREVLYLRDPSTIPLILPWGGLHMDIMDFGRKAFEPVLNFVETPPSGTMILSVGSRLMTLRMMIDYWGLSSFSSSERDRMRQVAAKYIAGFDSYGTVSSAISLASSLGEIELLRMANALLNSDTVMAKQSSGDRDRLQGTVTQALNGTLETRQYVPYEQRERW